VKESAQVGTDAAHLPVDVSQLAPWAQSALDTHEVLHAPVAAAQV
jgi:hypothetical protein